jgi:hypothetical protein
LKGAKPWSVLGQSVASKAATRFGDWQIKRIPEVTDEDALFEAADYIAERFQAKSDHEIELKPVRWLRVLAPLERRQNDQEA